MAKHEDEPVVRRTVEGGMAGGSGRSMIVAAAQMAVWILAEQDDENR